MKIQYVSFSGIYGRRALSFLIILFLIISSLMFSISVEPIEVRVENKILYVGGSGPGNYSKIQYAIDNANAGATVFVYDGEYRENLIINIPISLIAITGEPIINGSGIDDVIKITADDITVIGFVITSGGYVNYSNKGGGIFLEYADNCLIDGNTITENSQNGISLSHCKNNLITNNSIYMNARKGIRLDYSNDNIVKNCILIDNDQGFIFRDSNRNLIMDNMIRSNDQEGIYFWDSHNNRVINNSVHESEFGIYLLESNSNLLDYNTITNCMYAVRFSASYGIKMHFNNISGGGLWFWGDMPGFYTSHEIDTTNKINGKSIQFIKNQTGGVVPLNAGQVIMVSCNGVTIKDQDINKASLGILLFSSNEILIENCTMSNNSINGIRFHYSDKNTIVNSTIKSNYEHGIFLMGSDQNILENITASANNGTGILFYRSDQNVIANSTASINYLYGIQMEKGSNFNRFSDIDVSDNRLSGIYLYESTDNLIERAIIRNNQNGTRFYRSSDRNILKDSKIEHNKGGIFFDDSQYNIVKTNFLSNNTGYALFINYESEHSEVINNNISGNDAGLHIASRSNKILYNNLSENGLAITIWDDGNYILNNNITGNLNGMLMERGNWNRVIGNTFSSNTGFGMNILDSRDYAVYHNNFISNLVQGFDNSESEWNHRYPVGGNYWSDYNGSDKFQGPGQDQNGSDGIGDDPYWIGEAVDRFPQTRMCAQVDPEAPMNFNGQAGDSFINLTWDEPSYQESRQVSYYKLFKATKSGQTELYKEIQYEYYFKDSYGYHYFNDTIVETNKTYYYRISAVYGSVESPLSYEINITVWKKNKDSINDTWYNNNQSVPNDLDNETDNDNDGLSNLVESSIGTDPNNPDTDADGFDDGTEMDLDTDPLDDNDFPEIDEDETRESNWTIYAAIFIVTIIILVLVFLFFNQKRKEKRSKENKTDE